MLQIIVLNGKLQGETFTLFEGFNIGKSEEDDDIFFDDESLGFDSYVINCSDSGVFTITSVNKLKSIISGDEDVESLDLFPGLIFSINEIGFSIQEDDGAQVADTKKEKQITLADAYKELNITTGYTSSISPLMSNISFKFVRGLWLNSSWSIPHLPISFGRESSLLFFSDSLIPSTLDFLSLAKAPDSESFLISSDIPNFVTKNKILLSGAEPIENGDLIEFGQTAFYIELT